MLDNEPLAAGELKKLLRNILEQGKVSYGSHVRKRMRDREITSIDIENVIRGGKLVMHKWDITHNNWKYTLKTSRFMVALCLRSETNTFVITAARRTKSWNA